WRASAASYGPARRLVTPGHTLHVIRLPSVLSLDTATQRRVAASRVKQLYRVSDSVLISK
ncbi:MAG: hypothetical protein ACTHJW_15505, partial [Streptosporangiaceae bacterium]